MGDILINSVCISFMFAFNHWYYKRCCKPCRRCHQCVIMFTTNDTLKEIDAYPSKEMTSSNKYKQKLIKKEKAANDKHGRYNLFLDDPECSNTARYGSTGAKGSNSASSSSHSSGITCNATYGN